MKDTHSGWYLVYTKPSCENIAKINLEQQGFSAYLPLLKQPKRRHALYQIMTEPLFPRYLFVKLNAEIDDWSKIRSTRGCVKLVRFGVFPARIPDIFIAELKTNEIARLSKVENQLPDFKKGDSVQIIDGLLANYKGIIEARNSAQRITVMLTIAEEHTRSIDISIHQVKKCVISLKT